MRGWGSSVVYGLLAHLPYQHHRDSLYCWEIDPDNGFTCSDLRVVFDSREAKVPIRPEAGMAVDQAKIVPHTGGDTQFLIHRIHPLATNNPRKLGVVGTSWVNMFSCRDVS